MDTFASSLVSNWNFQPVNPLTNETRKTHLHQVLSQSFLQIPTSRKLQFRVALANSSVEEALKAEIEDGKPRFRWAEVGPNITEAQQEAISKLPPKMAKRCKALLRQLICFSPLEATLSQVLAAWVSIMKPIRADWLVILKQLNTIDHNLYHEVTEFALAEESFEANVRDYTKIVHGYGKENRLEDGFVYDQVILTKFVHIYSKAGNLKLAEETFEELKLLGQPLDKRSYECFSCSVMAYIRARMLERGENLLREMDAKEIYAESQVYNASLSAYSMNGNTEGTQRVFDAIQLAGISPDAQMCGLLINAYGVSGQSQKVRIAFENMRRIGLEASDKCIALGIMVGKEALEMLVGWFGKLGVIKEVDLVLREYALKESDSKVPVS
ncbi:hypothetical protein UlMin_021570 [Ulmus minor]